MDLYGTRQSHFTRKVRIILRELDLPFRFMPVENLMASAPEFFGLNPLLKIPVLAEGGAALFESDLICESLLARHGKKNPAVTALPTGKGADAEMDRQRLAVVNGGMAAGADIMLARRSELHGHETMPFFQQRRAGMLNALAWLETDLGKKNAYGEGFSLLEIALVCFLDWALFREMVPALSPYPNLERFLAHWAGRPSVSETHPSREIR